MSDAIKAKETKPRKYRRKPGTVLAYRTDHRRMVVTLHGAATAEAGDWIITGPHGDSWPCEDKRFRETYEVEREDNDDDG